jgi:phenylpyruvate tautomerase PptA (4-oxalocrotonate tautomerase family)
VLYNYLIEVLGQTFSIDESGGIPPQFQILVKRREICRPYFSMAQGWRRRREMIKSFTDAASRLTGIEKSAFVVYLRETSPEDVGVGGELLEDGLKTKG